MIGLSELNDYNNNTYITIGDDRAIGAYFDKLYAIEQQYDITEQSLKVYPSIDIVAIVGGSSAQVTYTVEIVRGSEGEQLGASTLYWGELSPDITFNQVGDKYIFSGITTVDLWLNVRSFIWNLPSNYDTANVWYLRSTISYYDGASFLTKKQSWTTYDIQHYLLQSLICETESLCIPMYPKIAYSNMAVDSSWSVYEGPWSQGFSKNNLINASLVANGYSFRGILGEARMSADSSASATLSHRYYMSSTMAADSSMTSIIGAIYGFKSNNPLVNLIAFNDSYYGSLIVEMTPATWNASFSIASTLWIFEAQANLTSTATVSCAPTNITMSNTGTVRYYTGNTNNTPFSTNRPTISGAATGATSYILQVSSSGGYFTADSVTTSLPVATAVVSKTTLSALNTAISTITYYPFKDSTATSEILFEYFEVRNGVTSRLYSYSSPNVLISSGTNISYTPVTTVYTTAGSKSLTAKQYMYYQMDVYVIAGGCAGSTRNGDAIGSQGHGGGAGGITIQTNMNLYNNLKTNSTTPYFDVTIGAAGTWTSSGNGYGGNSIAAFTSTSYTASTGTPGNTLNGGGSGVLIENGVQTHASYTGGTGRNTVYGNGAGGMTSNGGNSSSSANGSRGTGYTINSVVYATGGTGGFPNTVNGNTTAGSGGDGGYRTGDVTPATGKDGFAGAVIVYIHQ